MTATQKTNSSVCLCISPFGQIVSSHKVEVIQAKTQAKTQALNQKLISVCYSHLKKRLLGDEMQIWCFGNAPSFSELSTCDKLKNIAVLAVASLAIAALTIGALKFSGVISLGLLGSYGPPALMVGGLCALSLDFIVIMIRKCKVTSPSNQPAPILEPALEVKTDSKAPAHEIKAEPKSDTNPIPQGNFEVGAIACEDLDLTLFSTYSTISGTIKFSDESGYLEFSALKNSIGTEKIGLFEMAIKMPESQRWMFLVFNDKKAVVINAVFSLKLYSIVPDSLASRFLVTELSLPDSKPILFPFAHSKCNKLYEVTEMFNDEGKVKASCPDCHNLLSKQESTDLTQLSTSLKTAMSEEIEKIKVGLEK